MIIRKLRKKFYDENGNLRQILDAEKYQRGDTVEGYRGYGVLEVSIYGFTFGIPLHSNMDPRFGFKIKQKHLIQNDYSYRVIYSGLDYHKAILLKKSEYVFDVFQINNYEFNLISNNLEKIKNDFVNYINGYFKSLYENRLKGTNTHNRIYHKSTLINYHKELFPFHFHFIGLNPLMTSTYNLY